MGGTSITHVGNENCTYNFDLDRKRDGWGDLGVDGLMMMMMTTTTILITMTRILEI
jgi:hypothetical protein